MSFWNTSDGELATATGSSYEAPTGNTDPIPDGSSVLAMISSAQWKSPRDNQDVQYIELEWSVAQPEEYANRKLWTKLWVTDPNPSHKNPEKQQDSHKRMLAAIDANCGGKLAKKASIPTDTDLAIALMQRPMIIKVKEWEMNGNKGNWVAAVSPKAAGVSVAAAAAPKPKVQSRIDDDLDVPF